ncbi:hypothetical protein BLNAU_11539 [Blattamonas nauphoetae]|uniref:Uncharacterized protein n=1 Tax=Blattamonas nauphoetae TaxID=2049346 RepID=A0ABQ9XP62_9EUKA|nr:hypothetical protein BLNAU_11539 [Blattamonas nauphoetae]
MKMNEWWVGLSMSGSEMVRLKREIWLFALNSSWSRASTPYTEMSFPILVVGMRSGFSVQMVVFFMKHVRGLNMRLCTDSMESMLYTSIGSTTESPISGISPKRQRLWRFITYVEYAAKTSRTSSCCDDMCSRPVQPGDVRRLKSLSGTPSEGYRIWRARKCSSWMPASRRPERPTRTGQGRASIVLTTMMMERRREAAKRTKKIASAAKMRPRETAFWNWCLFLRSTTGGMLRAGRFERRSSLFLFFFFDFSSRMSSSSNWSPSLSSSSFVESSSLSSALDVDVIARESCVSPSAFLLDAAVSDKPGSFVVESGGRSGWEPCGCDGDCGPVVFMFFVDARF